jgi:hypothetical protein
MGSDLLTAEVLIPLLLDHFLMFDDEFSHFIYFSKIIPYGFRKLNRVEPEFCITVSGLHMDMHGYGPLVAEEEKTVFSSSQYGRHGIL